MNMQYPSYKSYKNRHHTFNETKAIRFACNFEAFVPKIHSRKNEAVECSLFYRTCSMVHIPGSYSCRNFMKFMWSTNARSGERLIYLSIYLSILLHLLSRIMRRFSWAPSSTKQYEVNILAKEISSDFVTSLL